MKKMIVLAALAACGLGVAQAQESPWVVRVRATHLDMWAAAGSVDTGLSF